MYAILIETRYYCGISASSGFPVVSDERDEATQWNDYGRALYMQTFLLEIVHVEQEVTIISF